MYKGMSYMENGSNPKGKRAFILLEVMVATVLLGMATMGIMGLFMLAYKQATYSILLNRVVSKLREETEVVLSTPYEDIKSKKGGPQVLWNPRAHTKIQDSEKDEGYTITVSWNVFEFPNPQNAIKEPPFKIINVQGDWKYRERKYTNVIQTVVVP